MSSKKVEEKESAGDGELVDYIKVRCQRCFKHVKPEKFKKGFDSADNKKCIAEFAESERSNVLYFSGDNIKASLSTPNVLKGKMLYFLKPQGSKINRENVATELRCGEMSNETLLNLEKVLQEVYVPVLTNPANQDGWGEVMAKNVTDGIHTFLANVSITLANTKGETSLPMPPMQNFFAPHPPSQNKDKIHLLENAIIIWTKQMKAVLKQDPEGLLKQGLHPTPDAEIKFWKKKSKYTSIFFVSMISHF